MKNKKRVEKITKKEKNKESAEKLNFNKIKLSLLLILLIQLFLLLNSSIANSYNIYQTNEIFEEQGIIGVSKNNNKNLGTNKILTSGINLLIQAITIKQITYASAQSSDSGVGNDLSFSCCPETNEGVFCQDFISNQCQDKCAVDCIAGECSETSQCELGCCLSENSGRCITNSGRKSCEDSGGVWHEDKTCNNVLECKLGCCVLGKETEFITENRCKVLSGFHGFEKDWRESIDTEFDCYLLEINKSLSLGACVIPLISGRTCKLTSKVDCVRMTKNEDNFYQGFLCSNSQLPEVNCKKQISTSCVEGKDGVYWFDSCGNRENIYEGDSQEQRDNAWNNGFLKNTSCRLKNDLSNANECGNCNHLTGDKCGKYRALVDEKPDTGNYVCQNLNCEDSNTGKIYKNGESWCVYDGKIGDGLDVVGSRHWRYSCVNGEIKVEGCADYRQELCVQSETIIDETTGETMKSASCRISDWRYCSEQSGCEQDLVDCMKQNIDVFEDDFDVCTSKYPTGLNLNNDYRASQAENICSMASQECTIFFEKKIDWGDSILKGGAGGWSLGLDPTYWECIANCDCLDGSKFANQFHDLCISLGDCGSYVNIEGDFTRNHYFEGAEFDGNEATDVETGKYMDNYIPVEGQFVPASKSKFLELILSEDEMLNLESGGEMSPDTFLKVMNYIGGISGTTGLIATQASNYLLTTDIYQGAEMYDLHLFQSIDNPTAKGFVKPSYILKNPYLKGIGNAAGAIGTGMLVAGLLVKIFGLRGDAAKVMMASGAAAGIVLAVLSWGEGIWSFCIGPQWIVCVIILIVLIIIALILKLLGIGDIEEIEIEFKCLPWQPPAGGDKCEECNNNLLKPCTEYRCHSLGSACEFINKGTGQEKCADGYKNDKTPPVIEPWEEILSPGYKYFNISDNSFDVKENNGDCVSIGTTVNFGIKTDELSQCKIDTKKTPHFIDMEDYFGGKNLFLENHVMTFYAPHPESLIENLREIEDENTQELYRDLLENLSNMYGAGIKYYVRCRDKAGNTGGEYEINFCIDQGPDDKIPEIIRNNPINRQYVKYGTEIINASFYISEPAECRYDYEDKLFREMQYNMDCKYAISDMENGGWPCKTQLTDLEKEIYIKCKDQPWLENTNKQDKRNIMQESYVYQLYPTEDELKIDYLKPNKTIKGGHLPITVELKAKTSGGVSGIASCQYSLNNGQNYEFFENTHATIHKTNLQTSDREYHIKIKCEDSYENKAEAETSFNVEVDLEPPEVVRVYRQAGLKIVTNEKAECAFDLRKCNFDFDNATKMTGIYSIEHSAAWDMEHTYYIRCKDIWGNEPNGCNIVVKPTYFED